MSAAGNNTTSVITRCMYMRPDEIIEAYIYSAVVFFTILNNSLLIMVMRRHWNNTNIIMCSMCLSCILFAVFFLLPRKILVGTLRCDPIYCAFISLLGQTFVIMMNLHLCIVSLDKYLAITAPLHYESIVKKKRVIIALAVVYILSIAASFLPLIWRPVFQDRSRCWTTANTPQTAQIEEVYYFVFFISLFFIPLAIMLLTYGRIYAIARDHHIRSQPKTPTSGKNGSRRKSLVDSTFKNIKAARTLAIVVGTFFVFWMPYIIAFFIFRVRQNSEYTPSALIFIQVTVYIAYCYPVINPIIYGYFNSNIRKTAINMIRRYKRKESIYSSGSAYSIGRTE
ncbi:Alpha-1A adrenergic receptor [Trichoplax sp. H2]|nr:Alpha-1A adrenergic receptor [Trichoplax sp. H2]|eukprot:RDD36725.1 Alpha-1A adrenergic receptor [Trichoplax sp. H2]